MSNNQQLPKTKWKRVTVIVACVVTAWLVFTLPAAVSNFRKKSEYLRAAKALQTLPSDFGVAVEDYRITRMKRGQALPAEILLEELVSAGKLRAADVEGLKAFRTYVSLAADETTPNSVLIRVQHPDGFQTALLSDGSIMALSRSR